MKLSIALTAAFLNIVNSVPSHACKIAAPIPSLSDELVSFKSCQDLENHVNKLQAPQPTWRSFGDGASKGAALEGGVGAKQRASDDLARPQAPASALRDMLAPAEKKEQIAGPAKATGTNNQVTNVDEADFVKFNGRHIFQIHGGRLRILKAWPANELNQIASLPISGQPQEMLMNESTAVVLSHDSSNLRATVIGITQPSNPQVLTEFEIPGQYKTARLIGDTLRIVNQDNQYFGLSARAGSASDDWLQDEVMTRTLNIRPTTQSVGGSRRTLDMIKNCQNVWVPKSVAPQTLTRIISIDLRAKKYDETLAYLQPQTVYASENAIYLAQAGYNYGDQTSQQKTAVHKFSLPHGDTAKYQATGVINGHLINQFALDEFKGNLRVATHGTEMTGRNLLGYGGEWKQISRVQVLSQSGRRLETIGQTPDLAKGERLYSARFDGDKGYVVTFRQVDPLFTIDLQNPRRPRVMGELKVPGFSTYIHMINKTHLLTIGQDADEQTGRARGMKLSIFDVSHFSHPKEVKSLIFKSGATSEASYEHKAFSFYDEKGVLAIPAQNSSKSSLLLFQVSTSDIRSAGEINMSDLQSARRTFFADNFVYAIGGTGVRAATLENPQTPISTVLFDQNLAEVAW